MGNLATNMLDKKKELKATPAKAKDLEYERLETLKLSLMHFFNA